MEIFETSFFSEMAGPRGLQVFCFGARGQLGWARPPIRQQPATTGTAPRLQSCWELQTLDSGPSEGRKVSIFFIALISIFLASVGASIFPCLLATCTPRAISLFAHLVHS